jgi:transcriptional regulator with XRE-family HTH domain
LSNFDEIIKNKIMETIGSKISRIRKQKGMSQEELSELAKINLRTIQRIEKDENEPRGNTLKLICEALKTPIEELMEYGKSEDKTFLFFLHLSVISVLIFPLGNIILPLLLWINKKETIYDVNKQGKNILNFQIAFSFINILIFGIALYGAFTSFHPKNYFITYYLLLILNVVYALFCAISTIKRGVKLYYPNPIKFLK